MSSNALSTPAGESPRAESRLSPGPHETDANELRRRSFVLLALAFAVASLSLFLHRRIAFSWLPTVGLLIATVFAVAGVLAALIALWLSAISKPAVRPRSFGLALLALLANLIMSALGALCAQLSTMQFGRGRQLRRRGRLMLPPLQRGTGWSAELTQLDVPDDVRAALAEQWRQNGRTEHASVAAFSRLSLDLLALGAPPALLAAAHADACDEIRHAELCFALARKLDSMPIEPGAFAEAGRTRALPRLRTFALSLLAVDSLIDGALHEGVSARVVAQLARRCPEPSIRAALKQIASDEGRHAAHGWEVVAYCLREGGEPVAHSLCGALRVLPTRLKSSFHPTARDGSWERWGIPGEALEREEFAKTRAHLLRHVRALVQAAA